MPNIAQVLKEELSRIALHRIRQMGIRLVRRELEKLK